MKKGLLLLLIAVSFFSVNSAYASFSFNIEQSGEDGVFDIFFETTDPAMVNGYTFGFQYDPTELEYVGYKNTPFMSMGPDFFGMVTANPMKGEISNFNAFSFGAVLVNPGITQLGSLVFNLLPGASQDGLPDLSWNFLDPMMVYNVDLNEYRLPLSNVDQGLSLGANLDVGAPVPIPSAVFLLGGGLCALLGVGRRKDRG